ncbi:MAG: hypothetical protein N3F63_02260 [Thermoplasmata archaeon]|nr:hypothetical protein [Thermoplasmata archaeon]
MRKNTAGVKAWFQLPGLIFLIGVLIFSASHTSASSEEYRNEAILSTSQPTLIVKVSVNKIREGEPTDITVIVTDTYYRQPVPNATVGLYINEDSKLKPTGIPNATTNQEGIAEFKGVVIKDLPEGTYLYVFATLYFEYGYIQVPIEKVTLETRLWENGLCVLGLAIVIFIGLIVVGLRIREIKNKEREDVLKAGWGTLFFWSSLLGIGVYLLALFFCGSDLNSFLEPMRYIPAIVLVIAGAVVISATFMGWYNATFGLIYKVGDALNEVGKSVVATFGDQNVPSQPLQHIDGKLAFEKWMEEFEKKKKILRSIRGSSLLTPKILAQPMKYIEEKKYVGGAYIGRKEVERFYDDTLLYNLYDSYILHTDPKKPESPTGYVSKKVVFPYADAGEVSCEECNGVGEYKCPACNGIGFRKCVACNGTGEIETTRITYKSTGPDLLRSSASDYYSLSRSTGAFTVDSGSARGKPADVISVKHPSGVETRVTVSQPSVASGYSSSDPYRTEFVRERQRCHLCNGTGYSSRACSLCRGTGGRVCTKCRGIGKLRKLRAKIWECSDIKRFDTEYPGLGIMSEEQFRQISAMKVSNENESGNNPRIQEVLTRMRAKYDRWLGESNGKVLLTDYTPYVFPVTESIFEWYDKKRFSIFAIGTPKGWLLEGPNIPLSVEPRKEFFRRHRIFSSILVIEVVVFVVLYKLFILP